MMATKPTLASVRKLVRSKFGPQADVSHSPDAPGPLAKARLRERREALRKEQAEVRAERETLAEAPRALLLAAELAVENGDMSALRDEVVRSKRAAALKDRADEIRDELERLTGQILHDRYRVNVRGEWATRIEVAADTLEELVEKITARQ